MLCQIVHVLKDGEPVRMSKRAGTFVTLRDLLDEVGQDAVRFTMLTRKADAQMEFDLDAGGGADARQPGVLRAVRPRPLPRRCCAPAAEMFGPEARPTRRWPSVALDSLDAEPELALIRRLAAWPRTVEAAAAGARAAPNRVFPL